MKSIVVAIKFKSAIKLLERFIQLFLENNKDLDLILRKGYYEVAISERDINIPVELIAPVIFSRNKQKVQTVKLTFYRYNYQSELISCGVYKSKVILVFTISMVILGRISSGFLSNLIERCADVNLKENRPLNNTSRESNLNLIHIENLNRLSKYTYLIVRHKLSLFTNPITIENIIYFIEVRLFNSIVEYVETINMWFGSKK